jgi:hypothetical protein
MDQKEPEPLQVPIKTAAIMLGCATCAGRAWPLIRPGLVKGAAQIRLVDFGKHDRCNAGWVPKVRPTPQTLPTPDEPCS